MITHYVCINEKLKEYNL